MYNSIVMGNGKLNYVKCFIIEYCIAYIIELYLNRHDRVIFRYFKSVNIIKYFTFRYNLL